MACYDPMKMVEKNWTPRLIKWLRLRDRPTLQVEALWALTNIAAGATDNTSVLLQNGVIPTLVSLLDSSNEEVPSPAAVVSPIAPKLTLGVR